MRMPLPVIMPLPCKGICRDGTNCLNRGRYVGYCWRHRICKPKICEPEPFTLYRFNDLGRVDVEEQHRILEQRNRDLSEAQEIRDITFYLNYLTHTIFACNEQGSRIEPEGTCTYEYTAASSMTLVD